MKFSSNIGRDELSWGITRLTFIDNFESFIVEKTFSAGEELAIRNEIKNNKIPKYYIVLRQDAEGQIVDGATEWTSDQVYLKNTGSGSVTATIVFLK